jgi:hypothetical protein
LAVSCFPWCTCSASYGYLRSDATGPAVPKPVNGATAHVSGSHDHAHHGEIKETSPSIRIVLGILILAAPVFGVLSASQAFGGKGLIWSIITGGGAEPEGVTLAHALPFLIVNLVLAGLVFAVFSNGKRREAVLDRLKVLRWAPMAL